MDSLFMDISTLLMMGRYCSKRDIVTVKQDAVNTRQKAGFTETGTRAFRRKGATAWLDGVP
jgi:hypothetical protein